VAEIAFDAGFESLSVFNHQFRRRCRMSPVAYRRLRRARGFEITLPRWFLRRRVLAYLGRDPESRSERVDGNRVRLGLLARGRPVAATVELGRRAGRCELDSPEPLAEGAAADVHRQLLRLLGLKIDPLPFERRARRQEELARLVDGRRGLSIPQTASLFDAVVWVVCGQQVSLPVAFGMRRRLTERAGARLNGRLHAPPTPAAVAELEAEELRGLGFSRAKADYLLGVARAMAGGSLDPAELAGSSATRLERRLLEVRGLGPWSVQYLMMRSFALADCVPVGDVALARNLKRFYRLEDRPGAGEIRRLMEPFAPHRSLATFHLWALKGKSQ
jgi:AraC family transcriptional regulator of adaptative response / DNA-3-methyladenine glycosylase II